MTLLKKSNILRRSCSDPARLATLGSDEKLHDVDDEEDEEGDDRRLLSEYRQLVQTLHTGAHVTEEEDEEDLTACLCDDDLQRPSNTGHSSFQRIDARGLTRTAMTDAKRTVMAHCCGPLYALPYLAKLGIGVLLLVSIGVAIIIYARLVIRPADPMLAQWWEVWTMYTGVLLLLPWISHMILTALEIYLNTSASLQWRSRLLEYVKRLHRPMTCLLTCVGATAAWIPWVGPCTQGTLSGVLFPADFDHCQYVSLTVQRVLIGFTATSAMWTLEKWIIQRLAVRYHERAHAARLSKNRLACYVVTELKHLLRKQTAHQNGWESNVSSIFSSGRSSNPRRVSFAPSTGTADTETAGGQKKWPWSSKSPCSTPIASNSLDAENKYHSTTTFTQHLLRHASKNLSRAVTTRRLLQKTHRTAQLFLSRICPAGRRHLVLDDFLPYFRTMRFAREAFQVFDVHRTGRVTPLQLKRAILQSYVERDILTKSLLDLEDALSTVDWLLIFLCSILLIFIWQLVFGIDISGTFSFSLSLLAATVFAVGDAAKSLIAGLILVFSWHPYDVGDRITVDDINYLVERIGVMMTTLRTADGLEVYYPNLLISQRRIINLRRSGPAWLTLKCDLDAKKTTPAVRETLLAATKAFTEKYSDDYFPSAGMSPGIDLTAVPQGMVRLSVFVQTRDNAQNFGLLCTRQQKLTEWWLDLMQQLGLEGRSVVRHEIWMAPPGQTAWTKEEI